jgi:hypothetical protein
MRLVLLSLATLALVGGVARAWEPYGPEVAQAARTGRPTRPGIKVERDGADVVVSWSYEQPRSYHGELSPPVVTVKAAFRREHLGLRFVSRAAVYPNFTSEKIVPHGDGYMRTWITSYFGGGTAGEGTEFIDHHGDLVRAWRESAGFQSSFERGVLAKSRTLADGTILPAGTLYARWSRGGDYWDRQPEDVRDLFQYFSADGEPIAATGDGHRPAFGFIGGDRTFATFTPEAARRFAAAVAPRPPAARPVSAHRTLADRARGIFSKVGRWRSSPASAAPGPRR